MTEVKTLNDIERDELIESNEWYERRQRGRYERKGMKIMTKRLKLEAIKWVKRWNTQFDKTKDTHKDRDLRTTLVAQINIFEHFFNITEEDLK